MLADEPTGALDVNTAVEVMALLLQLNTEQGVTILIITHDPQVARQCARQVRIHDGQLLESDLNVLGDAASPGPHQNEAQFAENG